MTKYTVAVDGMQCGMCEAHVNDAIRQAFAVKKVESSHTKKQTVILADRKLEEQAIRDVIGKTGYTVLSISSEPYEKKGFFPSFRK